MMPFSSWVREKVLVLLASIFVVCLLTHYTTYRFLHSPRFWNPYDHWAYIYMASHPLKHYSIAPFGWRILEPWTIGLLNSTDQLDHLQSGFWWWAVGGIVVASVASYGIGKRLFGTWQYGALLWCWFWSFYWATKYPLAAFFMLDGATYGFMALLLYLIVSRRDVPFVIALMMGIMVKECVLFCLPLFYTLRVTRPGLQFPLLRRTLILGMPALCILMALRFSNPPRNQDAAYRATIFPVTARLDPLMHRPYSYSVVVHDVLQDRITHWSLLARSPWRWTAGTFPVGALVLVCAAFYMRPLAALRWSPLLVLSYLQLAFAYNNERLIIVAFPAILALVGIATHELIRRFCVPLWSFALLPVAHFGLVLFSPVPQSGTYQLLVSPLLFIPLLFMRRTQEPKEVVAT